MDDDWFPRAVMYSLKVQARGGVVSENDFSAYSTALRQPAEVIYQGKHSADNLGQQRNRWLIILRRFPADSYDPVHHHHHHHQLRSCCSGHQVMAAPAPHAGVALMTALNILEGYNISTQVPRNSTYHWIAEVMFTPMLFILEGNIYFGHQIRPGNILWLTMNSERVNECQCFELNVLKCWIRPNGFISKIWVIELIQYTK